MTLSKTIKNIFRVGFLRNMLLVSIVIAVAFPIYEKSFVYPRFMKLLISSVEDEAKRTATHFSSLLETGTSELAMETVPLSFGEEAEKVERDFRLVKLKAFSKSGMTIYSTDPKDIGVLNKRDYFHNVVAAGQKFTVVVEKKEKSLEGQIYTSDVVETYVPIMSGGNFIGAFEIYYDITEKKRAMDELLYSSSISLLALAIFLVAAVVVVVARASGDVAAREEAQRQLLENEKALQQTQKISSLGSLAGGVAHEINNLLLPIMALTKMTMSKLPEDDPSRNRLSKVVDASERAKVLIDQVMSFSRQEEPKRDFIDICALLKQTMGLVNSSLLSTITVHENLGEATGIVYADATQIGAILMNLISNAQDAMEGKTGEINISLSRVEVDSELVSRVQGLKEGAYSKLTVSDTGKGMDEETLARAIDPFFTTKAVGEGAGLGLSTVYAILGKHDGCMDINSAVGKGTTVDAYIPLVEGDNP